MDRHSSHHKLDAKPDSKAGKNGHNGHNHGGQNGKMFGGQAPLLELHHADEVVQASLFSKDEWREMAQAVIDDNGLHSSDEFAKHDWELYSGALMAGVISSLSFKEPPKPAKSAISGMTPEELRKADLKGAEIDNCTMFKLIMVECFHIGTGRPVVGIHRTTQVATLQNQMNRKLSGPQHKEFKRCWNRMAGEGVVRMTKDKNAAHLDVTFDGIADPELRKAITWAIKEQMKVSPEWRGRYEQMFKAYL